MRVTCDALAVVKTDLDAWRQRLRHARLLTTTCWPQGRASRSGTNARNTDDPKDIEYRVEARIDEHSEDVQPKQSTLDETYNRRSESNEPTTPSRTAASGTFAPEAASTHEHKCSSRCAFVSLLRSPTTNAETIQEAPSSRYENYSMTPSGGAPIPCPYPMVYNGTSQAIWSGVRSACLVNAPMARRSLSVVA